MLNGQFKLEKCFRLIDSFDCRYFNDVELKSTQKQAIAANKNVHSLTINRADQTDAGKNSFNLPTNL